MLFVIDQMHVHLGKRNVDAALVKVELDVFLHGEEYRPIVGSFAPHAAKQVDAA